MTIHPESTQRTTTRSCAPTVLAARTGRPAAVLVLAALLAACGGPASNAVDSEDHAHAATTVTTWTDSLELFMEYPPQVAGTAGEGWAIHLTRLHDWSPVREGTLTLYFTGPDGSAHTVRADAPARPGIFTPAPTLPSAGSYRLEMELRSRGRRHEIPIGGIRVYESEGDVPHEEPTPSDDGISFLKEQQWEIPFGVAAAERRSIPASIAASGELTAPAGAVARVSAPVTGIVEVRREAAPAPGTRVARGEVLAVLAPTDADASYARLRGRVEQLEREVGRAERLVKAEAIPEKRLVEARHALSVARSALEAIGGDAASSGEAEDGYRFHLRSPIAGVVSERHIAPGQRVAAGETAFTVVDPRTLWLRLRVPAGEAARASGATGANFRVEGGEAVHHTNGVVAVGDVIDPESRTLPVILRVENPERRLKVGMLARGRLFVGDSIAGVAIPAQAVQDEDGLAVAYVETGGETFERRVLEVGPGDGRWTIVRSGVAEGERVVTRGAYQVHLASAGGDEADVGHGHPH